MYHGGKVKNKAKVYCNDVQVIFQSYFLYKSILMLDISTTKSIGNSNIQHAEVYDGYFYDKVLSLDDSPPSDECINWIHINVFSLGLAIEKQKISGLHVHLLGRWVWSIDYWQSRPSRFVNKSESPNGRVGQVFNRYSTYLFGFSYNPLYKLNIETTV